MLQGDDKTLLRCGIGISIVCMELALTIYADSLIGGAAPPCLFLLLIHLKRQDMD